MNRKLTKQAIYQFVDSFVMLFPSIDWYKLTSIIKQYYPQEDNIYDKVYEALISYHITDKKNKYNHFRVFKVEQTKSYFSGSNKPLNLIVADYELRDKKIAIAYAYRLSIAKDIYTDDNLDRYLDNCMARIDYIYVERIEDFLKQLGFEKYIDEILENLFYYAWRSEFDLNAFVGHYISQLRLEAKDQKYFYERIWDYYENTRVPYLCGYTRVEALDKKIKLMKLLLIC